MDDEVNVSWGAVDDATAGVRHVTIDHTDDGVLRLRLSGRWTLGVPAPAAAELFEHARASDTRVVVDGGRHLQWDSGLLIFMYSQSSSKCSTRISQTNPLRRQAEAVSAPPHH